MKNKRNVMFLIRLALAFVFIYAGTGSITAPNNWIGFLPSFIGYIMPLKTFLTLFAFYEIMLGIWILWGKRLFYSSLLSSLTLLGIIIFNIQLIDLIFRDIALFLVSVSLFISQIP